MTTALLLSARHFLKRYACASCKYVDKTLMARSMSTNTEQKNDQPIAYLTSSAAKFTVAETNRVSSNMLWYQPFVVSFSMAVFLIYFCILREENDIDILLDRDLTQTLPGFEKRQLLQAYDYNKQNGVDVSAIEKRLKEIIIEEKKDANK